ncbi:hypothetical protein ACFL6L_04865, partial [candidate division KSB1 bacterium]
MAFSGAAAQGGFDHEKMDRDLTIMEKVLATTLEDNDISSYIRTSNIKGVYLEGYGVVFIMNASATHRSRELFQADAAANMESAFKNMRETLNEFFYDYAGVIKQLETSDYISIVVNMEENRVYLAGFYTEIAEEEKQEEFKPYPFFMSVRKSAVDAARNNNTPLATFKNQVTFTGLGDESSESGSASMQKNIKIMKSILETALEEKLDTDISKDRLLGTYLQDYGALFVINSGSFSINFVGGGGGSFGYALSSNLGEIEIFTDEIAGTVKIMGKKNVAELEKEIQAALKDVEKKLEEKEKELADAKGKKDAMIVTIKEGELEPVKIIARSGEKKLETVVQALTEIIGDYGHTMRGLKPTDKFSIMYTGLSGFSTGRSGGMNLLLTATYKDILDYANNRISLETFKERVIASTYE